MKYHILHESGILSVYVKMCSTSEADIQYERGCAIQESSSSSFGTGALLKITFQ